ncbi:MAG TPA: hypothetical protein ENH11_07010 [Candidatus Acetothermia bacterium]|nr:hypothetical protein [Candidatus Acetothermia bacterium]
MNLVKALRKVIKYNFEDEFYDWLTWLDTGGHLSEAESTALNNESISALPDARLMELADITGRDDKGHIGASVWLLKNAMDCTSDNEEATVILSLVSGRNRESAARALVATANEVARGSFERAQFNTFVPGTYGLVSIDVG